jgi:hypothetical protein
MRTPLKPLPDEVTRWVSRARRLRWVDGLAAWLAAWAALAAALPSVSADAVAVIAAVLVAPVAAVPPLRRWWRPISALTAVLLGWRLRPGDRAWLVAPDGARLVLVTANRWRHVVVAAIVRDSGEGIALPRTRALLIPAEARRRERGQRGEVVPL